MSAKGWVFMVLVACSPSTPASTPAGPSQPAQERSCECECEPSGGGPGGADAALNASSQDHPATKPKDPPATNAPTSYTCELTEDEDELDNHCYADNCEWDDERDNEWDALVDAAGRFTNCSQSTCCALEGRCTNAVGRCIVGGDPDCNQSSTCRTEGACRSKGGECVALSEEDCVRSSDCVLEGSCGLSKYGTFCAALKDEHCAQSVSCKKFGLCTAKAAVCFVGHHLGCRRSERCRESGECTRVVTRDEILDGLISEKVSYCAPATNADCKASLNCAADGLCKRTKDDGRWGCRAAAQN